ncbi:hypothetical protein UK23_05980 [Lentzea aerocolonigenes]|uniref:Uncharacterized protein n=1 Tax=Lentzea aerocolonigenes TaxID=68170 RepID=A0A0F0HDF3_LENAE|nr:hypothetical protein [Lentzea aerocolonigenes]KJK51668.1 hypothetical protein UK23_05980 [Lentzea aerocolonigenes]
MSDVTHAFHSPLTLLYEWRDRGDGARLREFLVTGYTLDLVFFERHCVSAARALGARITVLGDAGQSTHEPVDVRHAGRAYQHGHVVCAGAFHPKLAVLVGDEDVWVAIGSGNPTMSGWGHNRELWLVVRSTRQAGPAALHDLAAWLVDLPAVVVMPTWIAETTAHVAASITPAEIDHSFADLRIFGNLRQPILEQLTEAPVEALGLTAPFFDAKSRAVRNLIARLLPGRVDIAVQPTLSQYNGKSLTDVTSTVPHMEFWHLGEERTSHGKLVEWTLDGSTTALVGSANLSAAAMLNSTTVGGNCELVASYPVANSLLPREESAAHHVIQAQNTIPKDDGLRRPESLDLLGARRRDDVIVVELVTNIRVPIAIETSPDGTPGTWMTGLMWTADTDLRSTLQFRVPEQVGGAVRARVEIDGEPIISREVFLTDTVRCLPRNDDVADRPRLVRDYELDDVFTDATLAARFHADFLRLLSEVREHQAAPATPLRISNSTVDAVSADDRWGAWLRKVESTLGPSLTSLTFPGALALPGSGPSGWSVSGEIDESALTDDEDDEVAEWLPTATTRVPMSPTQRQRCRTWARRWVNAMSAPPRLWPALRMAVARVHLTMLAAGVWGTDESWRAELRDLVCALVPSDDEERESPGQLLGYQSSMIAVCLGLLLQDASLHGGSEHDVIARSAWDAAGDWAAYAEPELVEEYLYVPDQPYARVASAAEVTAVIDLATAVIDDPDAALRDAFEREGLPARKIRGVWVVDGEFRNPRRIAAQVATLAGARCVVLARNATRATVVVRHGATLAITESAAPRWRVYQLPTMSTPLSLLGGSEGLPSSATQYPLEPVPTRVLELADDAEVNLAELIAAVRAR